MTNEINETSKIMKKNMEIKEIRRKALVWFTTRPSNITTSPLPTTTVYTLMSGVLPSLSAPSAGRCRSSSSSAISRCPRAAARCSNERPSRSRACRPA